MLKLCTFLSFNDNFIVLFPLKITKKKLYNLKENNRLILDI